MRQKSNSWEVCALVETSNLGYIGHMNFKQEHKIEHERAGIYDGKAIEYRGRLLLEEAPGKSSIQISRSRKTTSRQMAKT